MECPKVREKLLAYIEGDLGELYHALVESHLARCYTCREEFDECKGVIEACRDALRHPRPHSRFEEIRVRMTASEDSMFPWKAIHRYRRQYVAHALKAAAVVLLLLWPSWSLVNSARQVFVPLHQSPATFTTRTGASVRVAPLVASRFIERRLDIEENSAG